MIFLVGPFPEIIKPPIRTLFPVPTSRRVEIFTDGRGLGSQSKSRAGNCKSASKCHAVEVAIIAERQPRLRTLTVAGTVEVVNRGQRALRRDLEDVAGAAGASFRYPIEIAIRALG